MMDIQMLEKLSNAFGPSGFEDEVVRTAAGFCPKLRCENDAMFNLYLRMPEEKSDAPVVLLDAHTDECGFMVQSVNDNGTLSIVMLGGMQLSTLPAHPVIVRTRNGKKVRGIIVSKPVHFLTDRERASNELTIEGMCVDVGTTSRRETEEEFGISVGDPIVPDVSFDYDAPRGLCYGKAFDNRAGCACVIDVMNGLCRDQSRLQVNVVGALAAQEEVGERGAKVTAQQVLPDLAIVFEGSPSDDFFFSASQAQCRMKQGVQLRIMDRSYISSTAFLRFAEETAKECGIPYQEAVRRGGGTNAAMLSTTGKAVPVLVMGVPSRYVHTHCGFCAVQDLDAASNLAAELLRRLDRKQIDRLLHRDLLG